MSVVARPQQHASTYPCIIELGLKAHVLPLLLILRTEDLQLICFQGAVKVSPGESRGSRIGWRGTLPLRVKSIW